MLVHGLDGTFPQLVESFESLPDFINQEQKVSFYYNTMSVVGESATEETVKQVAIELLDVLSSNVYGSEEGSSFMFFAYDFGGIVVKQVTFYNILVSSLAYNVRGSGYCVREREL